MKVVCLTLIIAGALICLGDATSLDVMLRELSEVLNERESSAGYGFSKRCKTATAFLRDLHDESKAPEERGCCGTCGIAKRGDETDLDQRESLLDALAIGKRCKNLEEFLRDMTDETKDTEERGCCGRC